MKPLLLVCLTVLALAGCAPSDKTVTPQADRARLMAGAYVMNYLSAQVGTAPAQVTPLPLMQNGKELLSLTMSIARLSESTVDLTVSIIVDPSLIQQGLNPDDLTSHQQADIKDNGNGYDLYAQGKKVA
jgi:hypothetical protein